jgi:hypothetical protein
MWGLFMAAKLARTAPADSWPRAPSREAGGDLELDANPASRLVQLSARERPFLTFGLWPASISRINLGDQMVVRATILESQD